MGSSAVSDSVRQQFGAVAANYAVSAVHASGEDLARLVEAAGITPETRALDLGSGAGHTAMALAAAGAKEVVGIDLTPEMVGVATELAAGRSLANAAFRLGDVTALPYEDATFDVVTSRFSAHHYADPVPALAEAFRVLKPGGAFLLVDCVAPEDAALDTFLQTFEILRDPSHVRDWRASEWLRLCANAGLGARVLMRSEVVLDGADWVQRMRTPPSMVAMLRELFAEANPPQKRAFDLRDQPWGLSIPIALIEGRKPA